MSEGAKVQATSSAAVPDIIAGRCHDPHAQLTQVKKFLAYADPELMTGGLV